MEAGGVGVVVAEVWANTEDAQNPAARKAARKMMLNLLAIAICEAKPQKNNHSEHNVENRIGIHFLFLKIFADK